MQYREMHAVKKSYREERYSERWIEAQRVGIVERNTQRDGQCPLHAEGYVPPCSSSAAILNISTAS